MKENPMKESPSEWGDRFDKEFAATTHLDGVAKQNLKAFIATERAEAYQNGVADIRNELREKALRMKGTACKSGMCGHRNLDVGSVDHGRYVGENDAAEEMLALLEEKE